MLQAPAAGDERGMSGHKATSIRKTAAKDSRNKKGSTVFTVLPVRFAAFQLLCCSLLILDNFSSGLAANRSSELLLPAHTTPM